MIKLAQLQDQYIAGEIVRRLQSASIDATMTTESTAPGIYLGGPAIAIIWVADDTDVDTAREIYESFEHTVTVTRCPGCGYDLSGHGGVITCPECGRAASVRDTPHTCDTCGETVPANFQLCWNCGAEIEPPPQAPPES